MTEKLSKLVATLTRRTDHLVVARVTSAHLQARGSGDVNHSSENDDHSDSSD